ncbi:hypothetical protein [Paenibacillus methanolicus]|uniref:Uncharacterized protein n=1 Tax=Paenibacillus methanolicus TaxID=582686 RepID=A0A5S5C628_9BACL|nr:hypothetical protein [Paenibacillus methanolicus]TYP74777.1 hypothetical protein BCM02_105322 [Paenibacillus methanolicus]
MTTSRLGAYVSGLLLLGLAAIAGMVLWSKSYYPPLPFDSVSKREALAIVRQAPQDTLAKVADDARFDWYLTKTDGAKEKVKRWFTDRGWTFKDQEGAALFFERNGQTAIAATTQWTGRYVLCQIPADAT